MPCPRDKPSPFHPRTFPYSFPVHSLDIICTPLNSPFFPSHPGPALLLTRVPQTVSGFLRKVRQDEGLPPLQGPTVPEDRDR